MKTYNKTKLLAVILSTTLIVACTGGSNSTNGNQNYPNQTQDLSANVVLDSATNNSNTLPCGVDEVMSQMAKENGYTSAQAFFTQAFFSNADGACKNGATQGASVDCGQSFYTYNGLVEASQYFPKFACQGNLADRVRDIAGFFANVAQETYGGNGSVYDNTGGLYWRIENGGTPNTAYDNSVNGKMVDSNNSPTEFCLSGNGSAYSAGIYTWDTSGLIQYNSQWEANCPSNFTNQMVNILGSGNWIGHGAIQLTGDSIFYGTQEYNVITNSNLSVTQFASDLVNNDEVTWFSALAYWTMAKPNQPSQQPAEYYLVNDNIPSFGFGSSIYMINGGCNNAAQRLQFFEFFERQLAGNDTSAQDNETAAQLQCNG